ncbi:MAG TPA: transposase [Spirochaetia bacterium]|nr:transposase [Spirochaetia bacterium]HRZ65116.1 transposase [Spirochaetia bacterium]
MRKPRELREGARYHVTARANRREMIFAPSAMKEHFLEVVRRAKAKYDFRMENFCIMGNHFHFIIQPGKGESLSAIMQWILSVFAMTYNRIQGVTGHVWGSRFFSRIIGSLRLFIEVYDYIDNNPIRAHQVEDPGEWRWSGLWQDRTGYRGIIEAPLPWLRPFIPEHEQLLLPQVTGRALVQQIHYRVKAPCLSGGISKSFLSDPRANEP